MSEWLRGIADDHEMTLKRLEAVMPYSKSVIGERMNPVDRHDWRFVAAFIAACAPADRRARESLMSTARQLWEATAPALAPPDPPSRLASELQIREYEWHLELARRRHEDAQRMVDQHHRLINALMYVLGNVNTAHAVLTKDRDLLRARLEEERAARHDAEEQLRQLADVEKRMKVAEEKRALAEQQLAAAHRQLGRAQLLRSKATVQQMDTENLLSDTDPHSQMPRPEQSLSRGLMDDTDQTAAAQVLDNVQHVLDESAQDLDRLEGQINTGREDRQGQTTLARSDPPGISDWSDNDQDNPRTFSDNPTPSADTTDNVPTWSPQPDGTASAEEFNRLPTVDELLARYQARHRDRNAETNPSSDIDADHPHNIAVERSLAATYARAGAYARAVSILEKAAADYERLLGPDHGKTLATLLELGINYEQARDYQKAISTLEKVAADYERTMGPNHPLSLQTKLSLEDLRRKVDLLWPVTMPQLWEEGDATEGMVTRWLRQEGEYIEVDEPLLTISIEPVGMYDIEIPSPLSGKLHRISVRERGTATPGEELASIDTSASRFR
ncbi:tetratricopeptide repeat protein [Actinomadura barringtoniae]|uniref:Tetratricopeptide repeat protein n=1 Tax=Actinomadura barringtoniae TaxID=1427535 RepID=A0A939TA58_9ACTN|nr:tetratricopeptide repeat protein [Actinomadura barringtoniae]MBO2448705.1 tetratricopeptide repeat protein [Actinomadura barringtoniae]